MINDSRKVNKFQRIEVRDVYRFEGVTKKGDSNSTSSKEGCGIYEQFNNLIYVGFWKNNKFDGIGFCRWVGGDAYVGQYAAGKRHGYGLFRYCNGNVFRGEWQFDFKTGEGMYCNFKKKYRYSGLWYDNLRQGRGRLGKLCITYWGGK